MGSDYQSVKKPQIFNDMHKTHPSIHPVKGHCDLTNHFGVIYDYDRMPNEIK